MKEIDYISIIHREQVGELSDGDAQLLDQWKGANDDNLATYKDMVEIWNLTSGYTPPKLDIDVPKALEAQLDRISRESQEFQKAEAKVVKLNPLQWIKRIAAVLLVVLSVSLVFNYNIGEVSHTAGNEIKFVQLSDGSNIWLDHNSSVVLNDSYGASNRNVELNGRAFFDVERNENLPFKVTANDIKIEVLGTSFSVNSIDNSSSVAVNSGRVEVKTSNHTKVIGVGQKVKSTSTGKLEESKISTKETFKWTNEELSFNDAPLSQVLADLSNHFDITFYYNGDIDLDACPFTSGSLQSTPIEDVIEILALTYDINIEKLTKSEINLSNIRCRN